MTGVQTCALPISKGKDAIDKARETRPHAIILDVNLPDMDGHEVCRAIRADSVVAGVPVLMLTVRDNDADILAGLDAGADDYVAKDSAAEIVLARVRRLIQFRQLTTVAVLNEQLVQVGRLLAGIVHEIRGPLSVIRGSAEMMRLQFDPDDPALVLVEPILKSSRLLQVRLEHLMATVRGGPSGSERADVNPLVDEAASLFLHGTDAEGKAVRVEAVLGAGIPPVRVDSGRLIQILLSLIGNAHEAIRDANGSGRITVRTGTAFDDGRDWVTIDVQDDGPGIPEDVLGRIFEPFFTTKESGSGYGLYLASELVKEQQGRLTAGNPPGGGACFTVRLPSAPPDPLSGRDDA